MNDKLDELYSKARKLLDTSILAQFCESYEYMVMEAYPDGDHTLWLTYRDECLTYYDEVKELVLNEKV